MNSLINSLVQDPRGTLIFILLAFPGRLMAISSHEFAHAWIADRCGDHTARNMGRLTVNPTKHLDLLGTIMMLFIGFGWAKPVPINPRNYKDPRRDDLKVSIAGIAMNMILYLVSYIVLCVFLIFILRKSGYCYIKSIVEMIFRDATSYDLATQTYGRMAGYIYKMIAYFAQVNICLAVFNLIPMPPLDGYHVVNDLLLRRPLFPTIRSARIAQLVLLVLLFSGILGEGLSYAVGAVNYVIGSGFSALIYLLGVF